MSLKSIRMTLLMLINAVEGALHVNQYGSLQVSVMPKC